MAIAQEVDFKLHPDTLHKVLSYRNAFAHHATDAHPVFSAGAIPEEDDLHFELHVISSSGTVRRMKRQDALREFDACYDRAKQSLADLRDSIATILADKENIASPRA